MLDNKIINLKVHRHVLDVSYGNEKGVLIVYLYSCINSSSIIFLFDISVSLERRYIITHHPKVHKNDLSNENIN
jgi:hypothetical protein